MLHFCSLQTVYVRKILAPQPVPFLQLQYLQRYQVTIPSPLCCASGLCSLPYRLWMSCTVPWTGARGILAHQRYLVGSTLTEADIRLFVSLIRFDEVSAAAVASYTL